MCRSGSLALVVTAIVLPVASQRVHQVIDFAGAAPWISLPPPWCSLLAWAAPPVRGARPRSSSLAVGGSVLVVIFSRVEQRAREPTTPLRLFRSRTFSVAGSLGFAVGFPC